MLNDTVSSKFSDVGDKEIFMNRGHSFQDPFLGALVTERVPVFIYLVNGIKLLGHIESFDQFVVLLKSTATQVIYKRAISTLVPGRDVRLSIQENDEDGKKMYILAVRVSCSWTICLRGFRRCLPEIHRSFRWVRSRVPTLWLSPEG